MNLSPKGTPQGGGGAVKIRAWALLFLSLSAFLLSRLQHFGAC